MAEIVAACAGGAVLTAWALYLGCDPAVVAALGALPSFAQVIQLPSAWISSWIGSRRVAIFANTASRLALLPLAAIPFLPVGSEGKRTLLFAIAGVHIALGVAGSNAWVTWMGELVPNSLRGRYFGRRSALTSLISGAMALLAGVVIQRSTLLGMEGFALSGLAVLASVAGLTTRPLLLRQHDPSPPLRSSRRDLAASFHQAIRDPYARRLIRFQVAWNAAIGISASFFAVHLLVNLEMSFTLLAAHAAAAALVRVLVTSAWGRAIDRVGAKPILVLCSFGLFVVPLLWLAPSPSTLRWLIAFDALFAGTLWAGHGQATFQLPISIAPPVHRPFYLAIISASGGLAFAAAAAVGGLMAHLLPTTLLMMGRPVLTMQLLFILSSLGRLASAPLALRVQEPGRQQAPR